MASVLAARYRLPEESSRIRLLPELSWTWKRSAVWEDAPFISAPTFEAAPALTVNAVDEPAARPVSDDAPALTVKLFVPVTVVAPLRETLPLPVWKVPLELCWSKLLAPPVNVILLPEAMVVSPLIETAPVPVWKVPLELCWSKLLAPPAKLSPLPEETVILPLRLMPPEPDWMV